MLLAGSVGRWPLVGIAHALNDIEREEPRQEMLLPPRREVRLGQHVGVQEHDELLILLVPGVEPRRLPFLEGWRAGCMARELSATFSLGIMPGASEWSGCRKHHDSREQ